MIVSYIWYDLRICVIDTIDIFIWKPRNQLSYRERMKETKKEQKEVSRRRRLYGKWDRKKSRFRLSTTRRPSEAAVPSFVSLSNFLDTRNRVKETFLSMQECQSKRIDQSESKEENIFSVAVSGRWPSESTYSSILK